ncbi:hypothetical protein [Paenibacillus sp. BJ-4]|uniref:hypothetical protein n=1 Tax=Paenibacillus sp. BJ-4 TaxID=2878097 RepID=UPI001CF008B9|nr:hypothetical protein [Paenibacillus sp. BJ-4]
MLALLIITTGCWDQDSLQDARLANTSAYDITPEGVLQQTLEIDDSQINQGKSTNEIHSGTGNSVRQSTDKIRAKVTGISDSSNMELFCMVKAWLEKIYTPILICYTGSLTIQRPMSR